MKSWRAKQYQLRISRKRSLLITVRRFYAAKSSRSKAYKQLVIDIDAFTIREIAIRQKVSRSRKPKTVKAHSFWQLSVSLPAVLIISGIFGSGYFTTQLVAAHALEPSQTFSSAPSAVGLASKALPYSVPTHISIPSVGIDADIISVGQDSTGAIEMPPLFSWDAGWYKYSPTPGQVGPAIIVGHVDNYKTISVFWRLRYVKRGDLIIITRADGKVVTFKITTLEQYDQNNFPTKTVYANLPYPGLKLITCGGTFDTATGSYTENTVVSAFLST